MTAMITPGLINVVLSPLQTQVDPFGLAIHVATDITIVDTYATYSTVEAIDADSALSAAAKAALTAMLAPAGDIAPAQVAVVKRTTAPAQTYVEALTAAFNAGLVALWVTTDSRTPADIVAVSDYCESRKLIYLFQDGDSSWLDSGVPAAFSSIVDNKQTGLVYHPTDTEWADAEWAGALSAVDPDVRRPSCNCVIGNVTSYSITDTQKGFAAANHVNWIGLPIWASGNTRYLTGLTSQSYHDSAVSLEGEYLYAAVTKLWTQIETEQALSALFAQYDAISAGVPANDAGKEILASVFAAIGDRGLAAGHYTANAAVPTGYTISVSLSGTVASYTIRYGFLDTVGSVSGTTYLVRV